MFDKNGVEIRTGQVVKVTGAFFKNDNGLYFVEKLPRRPLLERKRPLPEEGVQERPPQQLREEHLLLAYRCFHQ